MANAFVPCDSSNSFPSDSAAFITRWNRDVERATHRAAVGGHAEPADIAQEVRVRLTTALLSVGPSMPEGYVRLVIRNAALNARRDFVRSSRPDLRDEFPEDVGAAEDEGAKHLTSDIARRVISWVASLPESLQRVYDALYVREFTQREAALAIGISQPRIAQLHAILLKRGGCDLASLTQ